MPGKGARRRYSLLHLFRLSSIFSPVRLFNSDKFSLYTYIYIHTYICIHTHTFISRIALDAEYYNICTLSVMHLKTSSSMIFFALYVYLPPFVQSPVFAFLFRSHEIAVRCRHYPIIRELPGDAMLALRPGFPSPT